LHCSLAIQFNKLVVILIPGAAAEPAQPSGLTYRHAAFSELIRANLLGATWPASASGAGSSTGAGAADSTSTET
jgi:hypothetical protein